MDAFQLNRFSENRVKNDTVISRASNGGMHPFAPMGKKLIPRTLLFYFSEMYYFLAISRPRLVPYIQEMILQRLNDCYLDMI